MIWVFRHYRNKLIKFEWEIIEFEYLKSIWNEFIDRVIKNDTFKFLTFFLKNKVKIIIMKI